MERWLYKFVLRCRSLFRWHRVEEELDEELRFHLDQQIQQHVDRGLTRDEATRAARLTLGGLEQQKDACRDARHTAWIDHTWRDVRFALRSLRRTPGFTAAAVVTLALGIGVNTAIFSIVNGVWLNPLPYPDPDQLVALYSRTADQRRDNSSYPNFLDWVRGNHSFSDLAAFREDGLNLIGLGQPERVPAEMVSASFFRLLGVQQILGRTFLATDDLLGAAPVVLISENFWKRKFDSSSTAIGQALTLSGTSYIIIGVIPATFQYDAR